MGARNGNDWSIFGFSSDPVPGDPANLAKVAQALTECESSAHEVSIGITSLCTDPAVHSWLGASGEAFRATLQPLPQLLSQMVEAYAEAASALSVYSKALSGAQATADKAYQEKAALRSEAMARDGGVQPVFSIDGGSIDVWGMDKQKAEIVDRVLPDQHMAALTCLNAVEEAEVKLRQVLKQLNDPAFNDFNAEFVQQGGALSDLTRLQSLDSPLGEAVYAAQVKDLTALLAGGETDASPDEIRAELSDLARTYQDDQAFWQLLAPSLPNISDWLRQHPGTAGPDGDTQVLSTLGTGLANAASHGWVTAAQFSGLSGAALIGLSKVIAAPDNGKAYTQPDGADFLAEMERTYINHEVSLEHSDGTPVGALAGRVNLDAFGPALTAMLNTAAENGDAARIALSGHDGLDLATQLLQGSATAHSVFSGTTPPAFSNVDPGSVAAFLDAARQSGDAATVTMRSGNLADVQRLIAARNVIMATAALRDWMPPGIASVADLPPEVTGSLAGYAKDFSYDLAVSESNPARGIYGLTTVNGEAGAPSMFTVSKDQADAFMARALNDPHVAADYQGWAESKYQDSVQAAIASGGATDASYGYARLVAAATKVLDNQTLSHGESEDITAATRLALVNSLAGGFGNAPVSPAIGGAQAVVGLLTPFVEQEPGFDTTHAAVAQALNHQADLLVGGQADVSVVQAAVLSGVLKKGDGISEIPPGAFDATGHVQDNPAFMAWYASRGQNLQFPAADPALPLKTLGGYVQQLKNAIGEA